MEVVLYGTQYREDRDLRKDSRMINAKNANNLHPLLKMGKISDMKQKRTMTDEQALANRVFL